MVKSLVSGPGSSQCYHVSALQVPRLEAVVGRLYIWVPFLLTVLLPSTGKNSAWKSQGHPFILIPISFSPASHQWPSTITTSGIANTSLKGIKKQTNKSFLWTPLFRAVSPISVLLSLLVYSKAPVQVQWPSWYIACFLHNQSSLCTVVHLHLPSTSVLRRQVSLVCFLLAFTPTFSILLFFS